MTFTVNTVARCAGQNHYVVTLTFAGGQQVSLRTTADEMRFDPAADVGEARENILDRLRSAAKEAGATTFAAVQTALQGKTFQV
jgi:hypothetical protein